MGNCCIQCSKSATVWAGDDWGEVVSEKPGSEKEGLLVGGGKSSSEEGSIGGQVRITISKKQLDKLLRKVDSNKKNNNNNNNNTLLLQEKKIKGGQILQKIIDKSHHFEVHHLRQWKPALQSIPEIN